MTRSPLLIALILSLFAFVLLKISSSSGTDLSASYLSCRLVRAGETSHLYAYDPKSFNFVSDAAWRKEAMAGGIPAKTILSPFVQTPLWPYVLQPLCGATSFKAFNRIFSVIAAACLAGLIWVTGFYWAPSFFKPLWVGLFAIATLRADPLRSTLLLTQTHPIFLLLSLVAVVFAVSRPMLAGSMLAVATAIKITPAAILIYWLITKRYKAAVSFVVCSALLMAMTVAVAGKTVTVDYLHSMQRVSNTLLLSDNNQSLAAWWESHVSRQFVTGTALSFPLPAGLKVVSAGLIALSAVVGGLLDRQASSKLSASGSPLYGAVFALLGATLFAPIAWSHYAVLLIVPLILLSDEFLRGRSVVSAILFVSIALLASSPLLLRYAGYAHLPALPLVRGQFYAELLAMVAMGFLYTVRRREYAKETRFAPTQAISAADRLSSRKMFTAVAWT
jgi:hypothetical protein